MNLREACIRVLNVAEDAYRTSIGKWKIFSKSKVKIDEEDVNAMKIVSAWVEHGKWRDEHGDWATPTPTLEESLKVLSQKLSEYAEEKMYGKTAHNAECVSVELELHPDISGYVVLRGGHTEGCPEEKMLLDMFKGEAEITNKIEFDSIEELISILEGGNAESS